MILHPAGREYVKWSTNQATGSYEASFDNGTTWHPLTTPGPNTIQALIAGPLAVNNPEGTITLPEGRHQVSIRLTANPEIVIRYAGTIIVG